MVCLLLFGFHNDDTEKSGETIATPPKRGVPTGPDSGTVFHAPIRPQGVAIVGIYPCGKARKRRPGAALTTPETSSIKWRRLLDDIERYQMKYKALRGFRIDLGPSVPSRSGRPSRLSPQPRKRQIGECLIVPTRDDPCGYYWTTQLTAEGRILENPSAELFMTSFTWGLTGYRELEKSYGSLLAVLHLAQ